MQDSGAVATEEPGQARRSREYVGAVLPDPAGKRDIVLRQICQSGKRYPAHGNEEDQHEAQDTRQ